MKKSFTLILAALACMLGTSTVARAEKVPEAAGRWTFDNVENLLATSEGSLTLTPATIGKKSITLVETLNEASIYATDGPLSKNKAIFVPKNSALMVARNAEAATENYTIMMDIKVNDASVYDGLFQTNKSNTNDGDIFINDHQIGIRTGGLGYNGTILDDTWYRVMLINRDGAFSVYVDGKLLSTSTSRQGCWEIDPWGFYLFCDEDGEANDTYVAEVAFWESALTEEQIAAVGGIDRDEYMTVTTESVKKFNELDFIVTVNTNTNVTFTLPEWVEAVDVTPFSGEKDYAFRFKEMTEAGSRSGSIIVKGGSLEAVEVPVTQVFMGNDVPEAAGCWTFDNAADLLAGTGTATLKAAKKGAQGPEITVDAVTAGIVPVDGPTEKNGAVGMPVEAYLQLTTNLGVPETKNYTIMLDVKPTTLGGYHALFQTDPTNQADGSFFIKNGAIGLNNSGLGYKGSMQENTWHRIVFVVKDGFAFTYLDGESVGSSASPNALWTLKPEALFFADNDDEDGYNSVAEIRFWDVPLTNELVTLLGAVKQTAAEEPLADPIGVWTFDDAANLLAGTGTAARTAAVKGAEGPEPASDIAAAGIVLAVGPSASNGAVTVPKDTYLKLAHNQGGDQNSFAVLMDIRPKNVSVYNALFQSDATNQSDADLFLNKSSKLGINLSGLGYGGQVVQGIWHRIVFSVSDNCMATYIDGERISITYTPSDRWTLHDVAYFFADEDGEEGVVDIAELRVWNTSLTEKQVKELGAMEFTFPVKIGNAGYATFFSPANVALPEGVEAYTGKVENNSVKLTAVEGNVPAKVGVILKGAAGVYELKPVENAGNSDSSNELKGILQAVEATGTQYVLAEKDGVVGFFKAEAGTQIAEYKAYLEIPEPTVKVYTFGNATGIESLAPAFSASEGTVYNLSGRRVEKTQKGLYIVNGRKVVVK
ncbi:MAG: LamG domain-containing protein [Bacteroidaceae bacterium]|nr:LamG domain-containing protein [Bacteroidaceae bacterium]